MKFYIQPITKDQALEILTWRYEYPYERYNFEGTPESGLAEFLHPNHAFHAILNEQGSLAGYCSFGVDAQVPGGDYKADALDLGLGIRPDLTGQGQGKYYAQAVMAYGIKHYTQPCLRVTIAAFNQRAQRVWTQLGFTQGEVFTKLGSEEGFLVLCLEVNSEPGLSVMEKTSSDDISIDVTTIASVAERQPQQPEVHDPKLEAQQAAHSGEAIGGGPSVIKYWAKHTLAPEGPQVWKTLLHKSACLSCAWGTGGQKGGFTNEDGETLQRCMKSVEAIVAELQPPVKPHFFEENTIEALQKLSSMEADKLGRLSFPAILRAGSTHYERLSWDEVYALVAAGFRKSPERVASYSSGRSSNEAAYLLQLMMRALGSNNLADCSDLCHRPSTEGLSKTFGSGTSTVSLESLQQAECVVLVGSNAPANHPRLMNELIKLRDRGGKIIVLNPVREVGLVKFGSPAFPVKSLIPGSPIANLFLQPIPGSDLAVFIGIQKSLIDRGLIDDDFLRAHTENWEAIVAQAKAADWETLVETCGISQADMEAAATLIAQSKRTVFAWAMGVTQQANGVDNICGIANTALLTGNVGKTGAGVMPIRGHSNVQGFGSMGVKNELKPALKKALEKLLGRSLDLAPGYHARSLIEAADAGNVDTLLCLGGNLYAASPDLTQAKRALGKIDTLVYLATKPNLGHFHGLARQNTLLIPVLNRFENPHKTTVESGNNFVRLNNEGTTHLKTEDLVAEVHFLTELAHRLQGTSPIDWRKLQDPHYVRELIATTIPGYEKIGQIDQTKEEFTIAGRIFTKPNFGTPSGKAKMHSTPLPSLTLPTPKLFGKEKGLVLALITGRSYTQHNTVVYRTEDKYRGMPHRHCILMHPDDVKAGGWRASERVTIQGEAGKLDNIEIICGAVRRGAALMFYPEANILMKGTADPKSHTPAYKRFPVLVHTAK